MVLRRLPPETELPVEVVAPEDEGSLELPLAPREDSPAPSEMPLAPPEDSPAPAEPVEQEDEGPLEPMPAPPVDGPTQEQVMPTSSYPLHQQANNKSVQCPVGTLNKGLPPLPANKANAC